MSLFAEHPLKGLFFLATLAFNLTRLPIFAILYAFPFLRQHPSWSFREALSVRLLRVYLYNASLLRMKTPESLLPGKEGAQWTVSEPAPEQYYTSIAVKDPQTKPVRVGGTWYPKPLTNGSLAAGDFVVLHFHGGAFVINDGRIDDTGFLAKTFLKYSSVSTVFTPQYRLASNGGRFPAHLQDAITTYHHLIKTLGIDPAKIIISGDSAGANIALALLRYLVEYGEQNGLQSPGCAWLWSPWVGVKGSFYDANGFDQSPNKGTDYITGNFGAWGARDVAPSLLSGLTIDDPYLNPVDKPFLTSTPLFISCGEREVLLHEDTTFYQNMNNVKGNKVQFHIQNRAPHDIILTGKFLGFEKEVKDAATEAGLFLKSTASA